LGQAAWVQLSSSEGDFGIVSIYAPQSSREKALLWHVLKTQLPSEDWIFYGDFNMIEYAEDSTGLSNLVQGRELTSWRLLKNHFDMADAFNLVNKLEGPRFTRRGHHQGRLVQTRLDRFYLSTRGWWIASLKKLEHISDQALSDHDPAILHMAINHPVNTQRIRKSTHFKANLAVLQAPGTIELLQKVWKDHPNMVTDPRIKFALACARMRAKYKEIQEALKSAHEEMEMLRADIRRLKSEIEDDISEDEVQEFLQKTAMLRGLEIAEANKWRRLARIKWLGEGEESSKFFFRLLKAKQKCESMTVLIREDDTALTDPHAILTEGEKYYANLYAAGVETSLTPVAWGKLYKCASTKVTAVSWTLLEEAPSMNELRETLLLLPFDKSPGIDGLTPEVFRACWHFIARDLFHMVLKFWATGELTGRTKEGIIKLIPKKADKRCLKDWRPLTMLTTIYKLIAKLLAL
jgi:hypothetical protein